MPNRAGPRWLWLLLAGTAAPAASAFEIGAAIGHESEYTSNTERSADDEVAEWIHSPRVEIGAQHEGASLNLQAGYVIERRYYQKDIYDDEKADRGSAEIRWQALPSRLDFTLRNVRAETTRQSFAADTRDNRQVVAYTEAGPTLRLQPRRGDELQVEYLYTTVNASETDTDSQRHTGSLRYVLGLSTNQALTVESSYRDIDYDNESSPDVSGWSHTGTYAANTRLLELSLTGGFSRLDRTLGRESTSGRILRANLAWERGNSRLGFNLSEELRDQSTNISRSDQDFGDTANEDSDLNEVFTETRAELSWEQEFGRSTFSAGLYASEEDYEDLAERDSERFGARFRVSRRISRQTRVSLRADFANREYSGRNEKYDELRASIALERSVGQSLSLSLSAGYDESRGKGASGRSYDEWTTRIGLRYQALGDRRR